MSNKVIHDLVLPEIVRRMQSMGHHISTHDIIRDELLETYFREQLEANFQICGSKDRCKQLEEKIKEAKERDPEGWKEYIGVLLERYINLKTTLMTREKIPQKKMKEYPDRFKKQREKAKEVWKVV